MTTALLFDLASYPKGMQLHKTAASAGPVPGLASERSPPGCHRIEVLSSVHYHLDLPGVFKHLT